MEGILNLRINNFLVVLAVAQTALILVLLIKVINLENQSNVASTDEQKSPSSEPLAVTEIPGRPIQPPRQLDERRLRQIVREELRAQLDGLLAPATLAAEEEGPEPVSEAEYQYRFDAAMQNLDYYLKQGEIPDADMIRLQSEIARLDEDGRRRMLSRLARAMSSGELKGQF